MLIVDEAHMARREDGIFNNTFRLLNWDHLLWMTGTPLIGSLRDIMSPLSLVWRKYNPDLRDIVNNVGCLKGMWHNEYDPTMEENKLFSETTRGIFSETFMTENQCPGLVEAEGL